MFYFAAYYSGTKSGLQFLTLLTVMPLLHLTGIHDCVVAVVAVGFRMGGYVMFGLARTLWQVFIGESSVNGPCAALLWQKEASDKSDISCKRAKMCLSFPLTSMEYHDVLPNIPLSRMSVGAQNLAWKKSTLGKI